jgi:GNAT superfamily N-acetyltransferase
MSIDGEVEIRAAEAGDLAAVLMVHEAHRPQRRDAGHPSNRELATWQRMMSTRDLTVYLAELEGGPVGTATLLVVPNVTYDCAPTAFIEAVVVIPERRRQGVAKAIIRQVLADAEAAGCDKVQLLSHKRHASDGAHDLYLATGFLPEAEGFRLYLRRAHPVPGEEPVGRGPSTTIR